MEEQRSTTTTQQTRLDRLKAIKEDRFLTVGIRQYLSIATVAEILGKAKSTISKWCKNGVVFKRVLKSPEQYNGCYLIPIEEVRRVISEDALPQPGNPIWIAAGAANPNPYPYKKRNRKKKGESTTNEKKARARASRQIAPTI